MAMLFITHDLSVVAEIADRVVVMYAGRIVEEGAVMQIFDTPRMPYTRGLLKARPQLQSGRAFPRRLSAIPGSPPELAHLATGCSFRPRCSHAVADCARHMPELDMADGHSVRCWRWREITSADAQPEAVA
ncbi:hypothetical protein NKH89_12455 [Mesorhizobium sp. M0923]